MVAVYDIKNCGPRHRFVANGKLVHNSDNVNLQNLPSRTAMAGRLKKCILAPEGYVIIDSDSSQIEARTLAWLAGQDDLVAAFARKEDVYRIMASHIYGIAYDQISKEQRFIGKSTVLGCGYGVGAKKLQIFLKTGAGVDVSDEEAKRIITVYRNTYARIPELWDKAGTALHMLAAGMPFVVDTKGIVRVEPGKGLTLPSKLYIQYPELRQVENGRWVYTSKGQPVDVYGGKCVENFTQSIARCVIAEQMLKIAKRYKVVLTVHDAVACIAPEAEREEAVRYVEECMSWQPSWAAGLPLACESGWGASYGDC